MCGPYAVDLNSVTLHNHLTHSLFLPGPVLEQKTPCNTSYQKWEKIEERREGEGMERKKEEVKTHT
jgi:hypothetical protein